MNSIKGAFFIKNNIVCLALIALVILSLFLRYYGFLKPHGFTFDEGLYSELLAEQLKEDPTNYSTQEAYQIHTAKGENLPKYLDRPLFKHPPVYSYLIALNYKLFGSSHLAAVSVSIITGCLMVLIVFFLGKILYDARVGLLAAFFMCIDPVHWVCSERIWMETTLGFFMLLAVFLFVLGRKQKYYLPLCGISIGLAMLTKYPGILSLFIIISYVILIERSMLKQKWLWALGVLSFLVFLPWIIWNSNVYGNLYNAVISAHDVGGTLESSARKLLANKGIILFFLFLAGLFLFMKNKINHLFEIGQAAQTVLHGKKIVGIFCFFTIVLSIAVIPFLRGILAEAFVWKKAVLTEWWNPFSDDPWYFYLTRLSELSPLYLFSYLSVFFILGKNKGDHLLLLSSAWVLIAFILLGNYQSRYILPAVPFLTLLSARWLVWAYDQLSLWASPQTTGGVLKSEVGGICAKTIFIALGLYFILKTLRVDWLIAIGPDFGYF